jgi:hypothetical protein
VEKHFASKSYCSWQDEAVIATDSYRSGNILAFIALKDIVLTARQKR